MPENNPNDKARVSHKQVVMEERPTRRGYFGDGIWRVDASGSIDEVKGNAD